MKASRLSVFLCLLLAACNLPSKPDCTRPEVFCVGLVTAYGAVNDHGLNQSAWEGVQQAVREGFVARADYIETVDSRDREKNIATFADEGYDLIVTVGFGIGDDTRLAADDWPGTRFIGVDQPQEESRPNLAAVTFPEDQGGFLAGALAALVTKTGGIGAVCESESIPAMWRSCEGFRAGVRYISTSIRPRIVYHPDHSPDEWFNDPAWGEEQAGIILKIGADVLYSAGGNTALGALNTASAGGVYVIGADEDMYYQVDQPGLVLTSAVKDAGTIVYALLQSASQGQFTGGEFSGEYALASYHDLSQMVSPVVQGRLEQIRQGLTDGTIQTGVPPLP